MMSLPPILKTSALAWPVLVGIGAAWSPSVALGTVLAGAVVLLSLGVGVFAGRRFAASMEAQEGGGIWGSLLLMKSVFVLLAFVQLVERLPAQGLALGLCTLLAGAVGTVLLPREV